MRVIMTSTVLALMLWAGGLRAQQPEPLASCAAPVTDPAPAIERTSTYVPMDDGVNLAVDLYLPQGLPSGKKLPTILVATRYWRASEGQSIGPNERFWISRGYAYASADVRGTGASYGAWSYPWSPREVKDLGEIAAWIAARPWSNGQIGSMGNSYSANTAQLLAASGPPLVHAVVPRFMDFDIYSDLIYPGGVVNEMLLRGWSKMIHAMDRNQLPEVPEGVRRVDADTDGLLLTGAIKDHEKNPPLYPSMVGVTYRDEAVPAFGGATIDTWGTYRHRDPIERSGAAIFGWASWLDAGTSQGVLNRFMSWKNPQLAVIGPWSHGGSFHASPFLPASTPTEPPLARQGEQVAWFFNRSMKGASNGALGKTLIYYTLGEEKWKKTTAWPIPGTRMQRYYLGAAGQLAGAPSAAAGTDRYQVDFEVSTGDTNRWHTQLGGTDVVYDERSSQDARMLTYTSAPLARDLEITGQGIVTLHVASTATDGNFFAYLEDVSPEGKSTYVTEGMLRAIHRKVSPEQPPYKILYPYHSFKKKDGQPLVPGEAAILTFQLLPTSVLFKAGHRIRIAIAGADKGTFQRLPAQGDVTLDVQRGGPRASYIELPVVPPLTRGSMGVVEQDGDVVRRVSGDEEVEAPVVVHVGDLDRRRAALHGEDRARLEAAAVVQEDDHPARGDQREIDAAVAVEVGRDRGQDAARVEVEHGRREIHPVAGAGH
jgi:hypothetical protein